MRNMKYQETGRFGRITKHLRKQGFELEMADILYDSKSFAGLSKTDQTKYVETVLHRMIKIIGIESTEKILFECGSQCCGKSWSNFAKRIWDNSKSLDDFFEKLNEEEKKYSTMISYNSAENSITVERDKCICGLINKGDHFKSTKAYCKCSLGHMSVFFNSIFSVQDIQLVESIYSGSERCKWNILIES